ncbi:MAG: ribosomal protein S12 methylthiotransferase [Gammaproteobacteria bacterium]|jgi:ribosomal protein S12 methylthiotransferase
MSVSAPKIGFVSLGCPKALVDSERIMTQLRADGYDLVATYAAADLVIVNTCGFIDSAKAESLATIGEAVKENGRVIVTGCLGVQADEIRSLHPSVLSVTGPQQYEAVVGAVHTHVPFVHEHDPYTDLVPPQGIKLTPRHYAYLKISEGCNHKCSFCIIPSMRGKLASRPIGDVMDEAQRLVDSGVRELLVISQDTSAYGSDIKYRTGFWQGRPLTADMLGLCRALGELGVWVRLHYVYPYPHVDQVIPLMADGLVLPYLDIPFQHGSPRILKLMRRPAHAENALNRINRWREICPDITLRSTFIVGFPGETDEDFDLLLDFIEAAELDRVGCFQYSPVAGAAANELPGAVPDDVKDARWNEFMECQQAISRERLARRVGQSMQILVDSITDEGPVGRSWADAPEIDGVVHLSGAGAQHLSVGELYMATISDADDYDLYGVVD